MQKALTTHIHILFSFYMYTGPPALTVNIMKNIERSSIVVQWDAVDDFLHTTYTIIWTDDRDLNGADTVEEQTSYTITGLTLDTVYTITVDAVNKCGDGPDFITSVSLSSDTTSTTSTISPTVTASTNPVIITSTVNPVSIIVSATTTTITTTMTITASAVYTTNSISAAVSRDTVNTIKSTGLAAPSSTIATTTTVTKCFGMYVLLSLLHTTVITNNVMYISVSFSTVLMYPVKDQHKTWHLNLISASKTCLASLTITINFM